MKPRLSRMPAFFAAWVLLSARPAPLYAGWSQVQTGVSPDMQGNVPFPPNDPWNTDISNAPVDPYSDAVVGWVGAFKVAVPGFGPKNRLGVPIGIPYNVVSGAQALVFVNVSTYPASSDPGPDPSRPSYYPYACWGQAETPSSIPPPQNGGDHHVIFIDKDHATLYEAWKAYVQPDCTWVVANVAKFDLVNGTVRPLNWTSGDAAGLPIYPGLVRYDESVTRQAIQHALRFTVRQARKAFVFPARHDTATGTSLAQPPMGARFRLKGSFDVTKFDPTLQPILVALKRYGMMVADNGGDWELQGAPDDRWMPQSSLYKQFNQIHGGDFELVRMPVPNFSNMAGANITSSGANFSWNTDVPANTQVQYGTTTSYGNTTALANAFPGLVTAHAAAVSGLAPGTLYHAQALSADQGNLLGLSGDLVFMTLPGSPVIVQQPSDWAAIPGGAASFAVQAAGSGLSYQWQTSQDSGNTWSDIAQANLASYTTPALGLGNDGVQYRCVVTASGTSVPSDPATVWVNAQGAYGPHILAQPADQAVHDGTNATFFTAAVGSGPFTYQWYESSSTGSWPVAGAVYATFLPIVTMQNNDGHQFYCTISGNGTVTSNPATLHVLAAVPPSVTTQPQSQTVAGGQPVNFSVTATGTPLFYQWYRDGAPISGANRSIYGIGQVSSSDNGAQFYCNVYNSGGSVNSSVATLTVTGIGADVTPPAVTITTPASSATVMGTVTVAGTAADNVAVASVAVAVDGGAYALANGTGSWTYSLNTTALANGAHTISALATDTSGNQASTATVVIVSNGYGAPNPVLTSIILTPSSATALAGGTQQFTAKALDQNGQTMPGVSFAFQSTNAGIASVNNAGLARGLAPGSCGIYAASGAVTSNTAGFTVVDAASPMVAITSPTANATVMGTVTVAGIAADNVAVASVAVAVDGGPYAPAMGTGSWTYSLNTTALANGAHTISALATDTSGNQASTATVVIVNNGGCSGSWLMGSGGGTGSVSFRTGGAAYAISIGVPAEAFSSPTQLTVSPPSSLLLGPAPSAIAGLTQTGVGFEIVAANQPGRPINLTLSQLAGVNMDKPLLLAWYDTARGLWVPLPTSVSPDKSSVWAFTPHFTLFALLQVSAQTNMDSVKVFPNPFRPVLGHTSVTFANLPAGSQVRIYTLDGDLVRDLDADAAGMAVWDGNNMSGAHAASGVYFAMLQGNGQKKVVKVAVQR